MPTQRKASAQTHNNAPTAPAVKESPRRATTSDILSGSTMSPRQMPQVARVPDTRRSLIAAFGNVDAAQQRQLDPESTRPYAGG